MNYPKAITSSSIFFSVIILSSFFSSCSSNEIGNSKDVNPQTIYFDYQVTGEEGNDDITVMLQYRFAGENGTTLVLEEPSRVDLDGQVIKTDSSKMTGAFYEVIKPVKDFIGKHTIVFTDVNKKEYKEEFSFQPITLRTTIPATINRSDLVFELDGLDAKDYVRVLLNDTAFASNGINRVDTVKNGRIIISKADLKNLVDGPVRLELYKEDEKPVRDRTNEGGKLYMSYGLKREFILKTPSP